MIGINKRKLPVGIQSFKVIREEGYVYVDKSDIVWNLANCGKNTITLAVRAASASLFL